MDVSSEQSTQHPLDTPGGPLPRGRPSVGGGDLSRAGAAVVPAWKPHAPEKQYLSSKSRDKSFQGPQESPSLREAVVDRIFQRGT